MTTEKQQTYENTALVLCSWRFDTEVSAERWVQMLDRFESEVRVHDRATRSANPVCGLCLKEIQSEQDAMRKAGEWMHVRLEDCP